MNLEGRTTRLRALEPGDIELMYAWENDTEIWGVSGTLAPFSRHTLERFIEEQQFDIFQTRQQRLIIETPEGLPVGALDLFDLDPVNLRAGVGILIHDTAQRGKGYAADAVETVCSYARDMLHLHQYGAASKPEMRRASHFSATPDSPKRGSGKSGCGLPTDSTTRFSCKKYYDLRRLAQRHKTNPPPISPNSSGRCSEASPRLPMCQIRIFSTVETGTTLPEEVAYTRIVSPMA